MNGLDIAMLVILGAFVVKGLLRGLLKELCSLLGVGMGAFLAFRFYSPLADWTARSFGFPEKVCVVAALLILFFATTIFFGVAGFILSRFIKLVFLGGFNRVAGGLFGLAQGGTLIALLLFAFSLATLPRAVQPLFSQSQLAPPFIRLGGEIYQGSRDILSDRR